jgi:hypothetical protein
MSERRAKEQPPGEAEVHPGAGEGYVKVTVRLPTELAERARNAAYWNPRVTVAGIVKRRVKMALSQIEAEGPYPPREGRPKGSRPTK